MFPFPSILDELDVIITFYIAPNKLRSKTSPCTIITPGKIAMIRGNSELSLYVVNLIHQEPYVLIEKMATT